MPEAIDSGVARTWIERVAGERRELVRDEVAIEEPLEIRVDGRALAVTMRTPGRGRGAGGRASCSARA